MTPQIALITGASRGLGAALTEALCAEGYHCVAVARRTGALEELDTRIRASGGSLTLAPLDLADPAWAGQLGQSIAARWGGLDLWCHTAIHASPLSPAAHIDADDLQSSLATNVAAPARLIKELEPLLRLRRGRAAFFDDPNAGKAFFGTYGASKAGQIALARSWAAETARLGPEVRILSPAPMATALRARFFPGEQRSALASPAHEAARLLPALLAPA